MVGCPHLTKIDRIGVFIIPSGKQPFTTLHNIFTSLNMVKTGFLVRSYLFYCFTIVNIEIITINKIQFPIRKNFPVKIRIIKIVLNYISIVYSQNRTISY